MTYRLLTVWGDVEPELGEPVSTYEEVVALAAAHRSKSDEDGVYWIRLDDDGLAVGSFGAFEIDPVFVTQD